MDAPTSTEIRSWSQVDFDDRGFPEPEGQDPDPLTRLIELQTFWLEDKTGQNLPDIDLSEDPLPRATARLSAKIAQAILMLVEHATAVASPDLSETSADINMIQSFGAGSYNENRRQARMQYTFHPWRELDDLLIDILTDEKRLAMAGEVPVVGVVAPNWDVGREIIDARRKVAGPFGPLYDPYSIPHG